MTCSGKVRIARTGIIEGGLTAVDLETKDGGRVSGEIVIDPETKTELSLKKGFNPTIIG
jgi:cytoskeletal protein CcmA (bactofilin family)